ncbi:MAG: biosynthetic-type acetolactate synthase large subunit [Bacillota bacterium]
MNGAKKIIKILEKENVEDIFGYPGGAVLPIYNALKNSSIKHTLVRHEQAAIHSASGYALSTNQIGVCIATSGPGATNLITGIANAYMDSIPVIILTGQVPTDSIGLDTFQEADIIGATQAFTKHSFLIKDKENIGKVFKQAFHIATTGRKGPVLIDIPTNIQKQDVEFDYPTNINLKGYKPTIDGNENQIQKAYKKINKSTKPLLCVGNGIILSNSQKDLKNFVDKTQMPLVTTLKGKGGFNEKNKFFQGIIGSHGNKYANNLIERADLLIIIGMSISTRTKNDFNLKDKSIIHIDIDPAEIGKKVSSNIPIIGDAKNIIKKFNKYNYNIDIKWNKNILKNNNNLKDYIGYNSYVSSKLSEISDKLDKDCIFIADVGNNQISAAHNLKTFDKRKFFTSGGLGTMGFSLPAGIGAKTANPEKQILIVIGDGGFQMVYNELITLYENGLNVKILLIDNNALGMVKDLQKNHYNQTFGVDFKNKPNFSKICEANFIKYMNLNKKSITEFVNSKQIVLGHLLIKEEKNEQAHFSINS